MSDPTSDRFLRACRREPVDRTPVWYMRQAGRYLPEYRRIRESHDVLEICRTPDLAVAVSLQPVRRLGVDAAILFSDIMVPVQAMGIDLRIDPDVGPVIPQPVRAAADLRRLRPLDPEGDVPFVLEAVRALAAEAGVPVIGFAGAPFTLASYLVEGGPSRTHPRTKALMLGEPELWDALMSRLGESVLAYLRAQVAAGARAVQLFDSWAGALSLDDYRERVLPASARILAGLADLGVPRIHFGVNAGHLLEALRDAGAEVVGVDWRTPLDEARARLGEATAVQGNLDPSDLLAPWPVLEARALDLLARAGEGTGHVFNLGHGVLPQTNPDALARLTALVHERTVRPAVRG